MGSWEYVDVESSPVKEDSVGGGGTGKIVRKRKEKERRKWRESEIEVLDLVD